MTSIRFGATSRRLSADKQSMSQARYALKLLGTSGVTQFLQSKSVTITEDQVRQLGSVGLATKYKTFLKPMLQQILPPGLPRSR